MLFGAKEFLDCELLANTKTACTEGMLATVSGAPWEQRDSLQEGTCPS